MRGGLMTTWALGALLIGGVAEADTLRDALVQVYNSNPTITGQRAQLRGLDEGAAIARAGLRPQVSANIGVNQDVLSTSRGSLGRNFSAGVDFSYPLFNGGRVRNQINAADTRVQAGRATLRAVEADTFTEVVAVYMDVIRDGSVLTLNKNQVRVLETELQASRNRFEVGDLTRTDVAQSEARLSLARSNLALAQGRLSASEENYRRVVGELPTDLQPPPPLPPLPRTAEQAVEIALASNPDLIAIQQQARAARFDVATARADRLPTLNAVSSGRYFNELGRADEAAGVPEGTLQNSTTAAAVGVQVRIPIYQGGVVASRVRQAQAIQAQIVEQGIAVERTVVANTRAAFASYQAALEAIRSQEIAVAANNLALEGTREEQALGTRNVLDVLNAEQELLSSQVVLVSARRDAYVAGFNLLNAMGQAEAGDLNLNVGGPLYDTSANYRRAVRRISDWDDSAMPLPVATRTVAPSPAELASQPKQPASLVDPAASGAEVPLMADPGKQELLALAPRPTERETFAAETVSTPTEPSLASAVAAEPASKTRLRGEGAPMLSDAPPASGPSLAPLQEASAASTEQKTINGGPVAAVQSSDTDALTEARSPVTEPAAGRVPDLTRHSESRRYVVKLGPFRDAAQVESARTQVQRRYALLGSQPLSTTVTTTRQGTFHKLAVAGFRDASEAKRICASITAKRWGCLVRSQNVDRSTISKRPRGGVFAAIFRYLFK